MYGTDVFAVLAPYREQYWANTIKAFSHPHNAVWLDSEPAAGSRQPTPALSTSTEGEDDSVNRLVLRFGQLNQSNEIQAGTDEKVSQILLKFPGIKAVSGRQFVIIVRPDCSVYLEDRFSTYGTRVAYDDRIEDPKEVHGDWILADQPAFSKRWNKLVVYTGNLAYTIEFPNHAAASPEYLKKIKALSVRGNTAVPLFGALGLHSNPITVAPSEPLTPQANRRPVYLELEQIASSSFGTVHKIMDMRDRKYYVKKRILKYPRTANAKKKRKRNGKATTTTTDEEAWLENFRSQMTVLQSIDHVSRTFIR